MHKYDEVAPAAFCASFIAYIFKTGLADTFEDLVNEVNGPIPPRIASFINSLQRFHFEEDPSITIERLFYQKLDRYETLQNHLNYILENERKQALVTHFETNDLPGLQWFTSLQNSFAGRFLSVVPKFKDYYMEDEEYRVALLRRLDIPLPIITPGLCCTCSGMPHLDRRGHHFVTACGVHGVPTEIHDTYRNKFNQFLHEIGYWTVVEERRTFGDALPEDQHRADIVIKNPETLNYEDKGSKVLIDFTFTSPLQGIRSGNIGNRRISVAAAKTPGRAAKLSYNNKMRKYAQVIQRFNEANNNQNIETFTVVPIAVETSGNIHSKGFDLLQRMADRRQEIKKHHRENSLSYFLNVLSVCYQTQASRAIIRRVGEVSAHRRRATSSGIVDYIIQDENAAMLV